MHIHCEDDRVFDCQVAHTALLMIDMQRDFFSAPDGAPVAPLQAMVPAARRVLEAARDAGLAVLHTREGYAADGADVNAYKHTLGYVARPGAHGPFLVRGEAGHDFLPDFSPRCGEAVIDKAGFSGFYRSRLAGELQRRGITHLLLAGVTTQCCVHSTLREAVDRGYFCLTLSDCCAAETPAVHAAALELIRAEGNLFGWITASSSLLAALRDCQARPATPK